MQQAEIAQFVQQRMPPPFASHPPLVRLYDDEVLIILQSDTAPTVAAHDSDSEGDPPGDAQRTTEIDAAMQQREQTRTVRMKVANDLQARLQRPIAWGMRIGSTEVVFTTRSVPVMTRLARPEREVLDTLVAAGVADTRSSALAYIVRAFATEHAEWLTEVRAAIAQVAEVRARLTHPHRPGAPAAPPVTVLATDDAQRKS